MNLLRLFLFLAVLSACSSCSYFRTREPVTDFGAWKWSETAFLPAAGEAGKDGNDAEVLQIRLAVNDIYCKDTACACVHDVAARTYGDLQALLLKKFKIKLVLEYFIEPYQLEDRLITGKVDGAICKPWLAYRLAPKHGMQYRRIADILDPRNNQFLTGIFIVCKDSPIKTFAELNQKALVTGDPYAYEKFYLPAKMLRDAKIAPSRTYTKSSCIECIGELMDGKADAAAISDYALTADCAVDVAKPDDFRIIGTTAKTPLTSVILDFRRVSEKDALRLQRALLAITGEITPKTLLGNGFAPPAPWTPDTSAK